MKSGCWSHPERQKVQLGSWNNIWKLLALNLNQLKPIGNIGIWNFPGSGWKCPSMSHRTSMGAEPSPQSWGSYELTVALRRSADQSFVPNKNSSLTKMAFGGTTNKWLSSGVCTPLLVVQNRRSLRAPVGFQSMGVPPQSENPFRTMGFFHKQKPSSGVSPWRAGNPQMRNIDKLSMENRTTCHLWIVNIWET